MNSEWRVLNAEWGELRSIEGYPLYALSSVHCPLSSPLLPPVGELCNWGLFRLDLLNA